MIATTFGLVLIAPPGRPVDVPTRPARRRSPTRIALRDLGRFQSRSGAALAAVSLALAIAVTVIVIAAANEDAAAEGNLSDRQVLVHIGDPGSDTPVFVPEVASTEYRIS